MLTVCINWFQSNIREKSGLAVILFIFINLSILTVITIKVSGERGGMFGCCPLKGPGGVNIYTMGDGSAFR